MQSDDDFQTTLSKWPFVLGDVLLVATALTIAILGQWQLTNLQVAACVVSVALGCGLFVLPYIVEYRVRVREEAEDRGADLRILKRHLAAALEQLEVHTRRLEKFESLEARLVTIAESKQDLSQPLDALDHRIQEAKQVQTAQGDQLVSLEKQIESLSTALGSKSEPESLKPLEVKLAAVEGRVETLAAQIEKLSSLDVPVSVEVEQTIDSSKAEVLPKKNRELRGRRKVESRLLQRAINQKQDNASEAVSRIIGSKSKRSLSEEVQQTPVESAEEPAPVEPAEEFAPVEPAEESAPVEPAGESAPVEPAEESAPVEPAEESAPVEPAEESAPVEPAGESAPVESAEESAPVEPAEEFAPVEPAEEPAPVEPAGEFAPVEPAEESAPVEPAEGSAPVEPVEEPASVDMFVDAVPVQPAKRARTKKNDTAIIASVFIGIGNKPYVRGSGGGLNWDSGIAMEFEEIGKWRWIFPDDLDDSIEIQLYRNDEDPDSSGKYMISPGQKLELSPVF